jgi:hypothetical protein
MIVTRSSNQGDFQYDPEIERTLHKFRREAQRNSEENDLALDFLFASDSDLERGGNHGWKSKFERACRP